MGRTSRECGEPEHLSRRYLTNTLSRRAAGRAGHRFPPVVAAGRNACPPLLLAGSAQAALGGSLLVAGLTTGVAPAHAHDDPDKLAKAIGATWLNGRLDDGLLHAAYDGGSGPVEYVDYGGTVEAAYALDAVGRTRLLPRITNALEDSVDSYITGADFGTPGDKYAGPTGKLLAFVSDLGVDADPTAFGGTDLVAQMESLTTDAGPDAGQIADAALLQLRQRVRPDLGDPRTAQRGLSGGRRRRSTSCSRSSATTGTSRRTSTPAARRARTRPRSP